MEMDYKENLERHSDLFNSMVKLIPTDYYVMKDEDFVQSTRYFQNRKKKTSKEVHKEKRMNAKRKKLDPQTNEGGGESDGGESPIPSDSEDGEGVVDYSKAVNISAVKSLPLSELRERLKNKIEEMRVGRNADDLVKKKKTKEGGKPKKKKSRVASQVPNDPSHSTDQNISDGETTMEFNRVKISSSKTKDKAVKKKRTGKKELEYMLKKAKQHEEKIKDIADGDSKKAEEVLENEQWRKAMSKASGVKKKDDPVLLQKSLKKLEKKKKRSSKEWKKRKEVQEQFKKKKQDKREKNIKERIEQKKKRKAAKKNGIKSTKKKAN